MSAALPISLLLIRTAYSVMISRYSLLQKRSRIAIMPYKAVDDIEKVSVGELLNSGNLRRDKRLAKALDNALQCEGKFFRQV